MRDDILCVILGGGRGTRLFPLTKDRAKPAVPLFGKYRLIDIPISNCINSGFSRINILTQFNSESLNKHISRTYKFDQFSQGYVDILAADQTMDNTGWFQGPADAVRKSLKHFNNPKIKYICILSGDQLYKMDLCRFFDFHVAKKSQITVACHLIRTEEVSRFGIVGADASGRIMDFVEKPKDAQEVGSWAVGHEGQERYLCSMGIYFFDKDVLFDVLKDGSKADFGKEVIPASIKTKRSFAYPFEGYWRDIGTIPSFFEENLRMTQPDPPINLFDEDWQFFTRSRSLPPAQCVNARIENSIVADGCVIDAAVIKGSVVGLRSIVGRDALVENSIIMGADYYEAKKDSVSTSVGVGIGAGSVVRRAILDKNARIGQRVRIENKLGLKEAEGPGYLIRDGIVIVCKNAVIPPGTVI